MSHNIFPGPIAPLNNPPINPQFYQPSQFFVTNIQLGVTTVVTMEANNNTTNNNYVVGQLVRLIVPDPYGCYQLNEQLAYVIAIPASNQVTLALDSSNANAFVASPPFTKNKPQIVAVGDIATGTTNTLVFNDNPHGRSPTQTAIPGSFINISNPLL